MDEIHAAGVIRNKLCRIDAGAPCPGGVDFEGYIVRVRVFHENVNHGFAVVDVEIVVVVVVAVAKAGFFALFADLIERLGTPECVVAGLYPEARIDHELHARIRKIGNHFVGFRRVHMAADRGEAVALDEFSELFSAVLVIGAFVHFDALIAGFFGHPHVVVEVSCDLSDE